MEKGKVYEMQYLTDTEKEIIDALRMRKDSEILCVRVYPNFETVNISRVSDESRAREWFGFFGEEYSTVSGDRTHYTANGNRQVSVYLNE